MVTVRLFAAARAAAGAGEFRVPAGSVANVVAGVLAEADARLALVLPHCALVADGLRLDPSGAATLVPGTVIDVLPPFAGG